MNAWLESIGNLQRVRPPPADETILPCKECGVKKPPDDYYMKTTTKYSYRQRICITCVLLRERSARAAKRVQTKGPRDLILEVLDGPVSVRHLSEQLNLDRANVDRHVKRLIDDGLAAHAGFTSHKFCKLIPLYRRSTSTDF